MTTVGIPFILEDKTGDISNSDFDEIYDRMFLRTKTTSGLNGGGIKTCLYDEGRRSTTLGAHYGNPLVVLEFAPNNGLGRVTFIELSSSILMTDWIRKTSFFGKSLLRKFRASDGQEYKWSCRPTHDKEWLCTNMNNYPVAYYTVKGPQAERLAYRSSGNILTIYEAYGGIAIGDSVLHYLDTTFSYEVPWHSNFTELLASLTIMRHIQQHNL